MLDEVDSLLADRRNAVRSWEVTQVNELLQQLESYRGIVACTTNRWEALDPAVLRRFTFKIEMKPPTTEQMVKLFWVIFEKVLAQGPSEAADLAVHGAFARGGLGGLGEVAGVATRLFSLCQRVTVDEILTELRQSPSRGVGFMWKGV